MADYFAELDDVVLRLRRQLTAKSTSDTAHMHIPESHVVLMRRLMKGEGLRMNEIAQLLAVRPSTVSAIIDHLEEVHIVERQPDPLDRRATIITMTEAGKAKWAEMEKARVGMMKRLLSTLNEDDKKELLRICAKVLSGLESQNQKDSMHE